MSNYYHTITDYMNQSNGAMPLLYSIRDSIPYSFTALLLIIYVVLVAGQYFVIKNKSNRGKILTALLSSSIIMVILSMFLALAQLVTFMDVLFYAFCSVLFFALYHFSDNF